MNNPHDDGSCLTDKWHDIVVNVGKALKNQTKFTKRDTFYWWTEYIFFCFCKHKNPTNLRKKITSMIMFFQILLTNN